MGFLNFRRCFGQIVLASTILVSVAACSDSGSPADKPDGGQAGSSGLAGAGGSKSAAGGTSGAAGAAGGSTGAAGSTALAGSSGSGGKLGGATATGGNSTVAGTTATGGKSTGGATTGGATTGGATTGGTKTGGATTGGTTTGGATGTGGKTSTGGTTGTGGTSATGGATGGSTGSGGTTGNTGDYGFTYRPVADKQIDFLCTLNAVGASTYVYAQMNQTGTKSAGIATIPVYTVVLAKISVNGAVTDLANPLYDYGTGHNIDSLRFDLQGKTYEYYHSSFGFGYRPCQPMDCINIYAPGGTTPTTEGCTSARTLPEACVQIKADGTHDPLKDNFKKCPGSSN